MSNVNVYREEALPFECVMGVGFGNLNALSAIVKEEILNSSLPGLYMSNITISTKDKLALKITPGVILGLSTPKGRDFFRVTKIQKNINTTEIEALHVSYDLHSYFINDRFWSNEKLDEIWQDVLESGGLNDFSGYSNIYDKNSVRIVRETVLDGIINLNKDNTIINRWGGELERYQWSINMKNMIGDDTNVLIKYGKNITGIEHTVDSIDVFHAVVPSYMYTNEDNEKELRVLSVVTCPGYSKIYQPKTIGHHFSDLEIGYIEFPDGVAEYTSKEAADEYVLNLVDEFWESGKHKPKITTNVSFIDIRRTEEYKNAFSKNVKLKIKDVLQRLDGFTVGEIIGVIGNLTIEKILTTDWLKNAVANSIKIVLSEFLGVNIVAVLDLIGNLTIEEILTTDWLSIVTKEELLLWDSFLELEKLYIGDKVRVLWDEHLDIQQRVISYEWDACRDKYNEITLGQPSSTIYEMVKKIR